MRQRLYLSNVLLSCFTAFCLGSCSSGADKAANDALAARVKRGDYLVNAVANCMHCHADRDFTKFSGPTRPGTEGSGGQRKGVVVRGITPTTLGSWTDEELVRAITTGINNKGDTLFPTMPYMNYRYLTPYDAESIVAYLRTLNPLPDSIPDRDLSNYPPGIVASMYRDWYGDDIYQSLSQPKGDEELLKGKYLVTLAGCLGCHTNIDRKAMAFKRDSVFAGGQLSNKPGNNFKVYSANITPDTTTGIGAWSEEVFLAKFKNYRDREAYDYNPGKYNSEMPWTLFANMTDEDIRSIYRYLRTIRPIRKQVTKWPQ